MKKDKSKTQVNETETDSKSETNGDNKVSADSVESENEKGTDRQSFVDNLSDDEKENLQNDVDEMQTALDSSSNPANFPRGPDKLASKEEKDKFLTDQTEIAESRETFVPDHNGD